MRELRNKMKYWIMSSYTGKVFIWKLNKKWNMFLDKHQVSDDEIMGFVITYLKSRLTGDSNSIDIGMNWKEIMEVNFK